ncbi:SDR family oxidoreductase [Patulibacter brassicae]|jgi:NADP-dependent 3-hydroxy acid dehydrogenase YdfG|uniref:SDR family oxidoreductase n=1 Tax=Patulibacter brassicae TaxID=1705717 RepID=A0ABU4VS16_9ACTN|nr:SDR family oxidoreductase [Patulibacter brassicae]MDX8153736.1 SDR family oxidoreductase [Patulibacter brassicae]
MATKQQITGSRVVAITGAARGIGLATAKALHAAGCKVALGDIDAEEARRQAEGLGERAVGLAVDVTDPASFASFLADAEQALGPIDVLHNNAGIMPIGPFLDESPETAERVLRINVQGCLNGMKAALPGMLARGRGHIINTASVAGKSPVPGGLTYAASKAAVVSATETARVEYAGRGLHFTCVMPSFTNTDLVNGTSGTRFVKNVEPEDVAEAIVDVVRRPRPDVVVPRILTGVLKTQPLLGRRLRDTMNHLIKADRAFLEIDQQARAGYEQRIGTTPARAPLTAAPADEPAVEVDPDEVLDQTR